jgi:lysophospholipase L1-like esterase
MMPNLTRRCVSVLATAGTATALVLIGTGAAQASSTDYVALGDSYSSGVGAGDYTSASGDCDISTASYPYLWDGANAPSSFTDETCSGAETTDVISSQLGALSASTTLVSITIGGNDVGFSSVMEDCVLEGTSDCESAVAGAESYAENTLPGRLDAVYADIAADAPHARVVVLGYPEFYDLAQSGTCVGLSYDSRSAIDGGADVLDGVIQKAAQKYGFTYVDIRPYFTGHEICDSDSYLHSLNFLDIDESYHPTAAGQADAYYPAFEAGVSD